MPVVAGVLAATIAAGPSVAPLDRFPQAAKAYVIVADGRVVAERAADAPLPPASLTKILTALAVTDESWKDEDVLTVSAAAAAVPGARLGLRPGERIRAGDALIAMLVRSCNDAAVVLAEHHAGSVSRFVDAMNAKAKALGLKASRFMNPTGLDAPGHVASAHDLVRLAEAALAEPELARTVAMERATVRTLSGRSFELVSSNALLGRLPGARGLKTGHTSAAGDCLIAFAERDGHRVLVVLLGAKDRWWTAAALVEAGFTAATAPQ